MELKYENLKKPSNKKWKAIADFFLFYMLPGFNVFFVAIGTSKLISPELSLWGCAVTSLLITLFKGLTKFTAEPEV